jgi:hypothetical protein
MTGLSIARAGHIPFRSHVAFQIFRDVAASIAAYVEAARRSAEAERQFDELCRMSPEQLARLGLTKSDLTRRIFEDCFGDEP